MSVKLTIKPISFKDACKFVREHHRHHKPPQGWKFGMSAYLGNELVGVAMVGRPVARYKDDGETFEVIRCCVNGTKNAASLLYAASARAASALGYTRVITYILETETGVSLRAAGYELLNMTKGCTWNRDSRPREDKHPLCDKECWVRYVS